MAASRGINEECASPSRPAIQERSAACSVRVSGTQRTAPCVPHHALHGTQGTAPCVPRHTLRMHFSSDQGHHTTVRVEASLTCENIVMAFACKATAAIHVDATSILTLAHTALSGSTRPFVAAVCVCRARVSQVCAGQARLRFGTVARLPSTAELWPLAAARLAG